MKIISPWDTLCREPREPKRKMLEETHILSHYSIVKDCPWDESRGSFVDRKMEYEPAASLTIIKHLVISPCLCISTYGKGIISLNLISNITHAKSQCAQNLPMKRIRKFRKVSLTSMCNFQRQRIHSTIPKHLKLCEGALKIGSDGAGVVA